MYVADSHNRLICLDGQYRPQTIPAIVNNNPPINPSIRQVMHPALLSFLSFSLNTPPTKNQITVLAIVPITRYVKNFMVLESSYML